MYKQVTICAWVAELVDARDLKSLGAQSLYEFKSRPGHHRKETIKGLAEWLALWFSVAAVKIEMQCLKCDDLYPIVDSS